MTECVPAEPEKPDAVTKTWAEEVDEAYPVSDDDLTYFPDTFVEEYTEDVQCGKNLQVIKSGTTAHEDDVVIKTVSIEPKY